ncbi:hypothetical protein K438DRAFT_177893 [Mycena galopus ATCC 62051]|nr:hypothetical protein K438DRAFT_177893 [Mycena galopus ATCC 62051]
MGVTTAPRHLAQRCPPFWLPRHPTRSCCCALPRGRWQSPPRARSHRQHFGRRRRAHSATDIHPPRCLAATCDQRPGTGPLQAGMDDHITMMHSACFKHLARSYEPVDLPARKLSRRRKVGTWSLLGGGLPRIPACQPASRRHSFIVDASTATAARALPVVSHVQPGVCSFVELVPFGRRFTRAAEQRDGRMRIGSPGAS